MEPKPTNREEKKLANRQTILLLAKELFEQKGIGQTSVQAIMKKAGLGTGTFYNYFQSKEELIETLILNQIDESKIYLEDLLTKDLSTPELIKSFLLAVDEAFKENRVLIGYLFHQRDPSTPLQAPGNHDKIFKKMVLSLLAKGQDRGDITKAYTPETLWSVFHSLLQTRLLGTFAKDKDNNLDQQIDIILQGILPERG